MISTFIGSRPGGARAFVCSGGVSVGGVCMGVGADGGFSRCRAVVRWAPPKNHRNAKMGTTQNHPNTQKTLKNHFGFLRLHSVLQSNQRSCGPLVFLSRVNCLP